MNNDFEQWWEKHGQFCRSGGGEYEKTFAFRAWEAATAAECERICTAIKAEDDHCADGDYMLDSDDCIAVAQGKWERPDWNCGTPSNAELRGRPLADGPALAPGYAAKVGAGGTAVDIAQAPDIHAELTMAAFHREIAK